MSVGSFWHLGREWDSRGLGSGVAVCVDSQTSEADCWSVAFRCVSDPERGQCVGYIAKPDPRDTNDDDLKGALEDALIVRAVGQANGPVTAAEIAAATRLSITAVRERLRGLPYGVDWDCNEMDPFDDEPRYFRDDAAQWDELFRRFEANFEDEDAGGS